MNNVVFHGHKNYIDGIIQTRINWCLTPICNFKCHYCPCYKESLTSKQKFNTWEHNTKIVDFIFEHPSERIELLLCGGEISIYPKFLKLMEYFNEKNKDSNKQITLVLYTNFSQNIDFYRNFYKSLSSVFKVKLLISYHREFVNIEKFGEKYIQLEQEGYDLGDKIPFMLHSEECKDNFRDVIKKYPGIPFSLSPIFENPDVIKGMEDLDYCKHYTDPDLISVIYKNGEYFYKTGIHPKNGDFKFYICSSHSKMLFIDEKGFIHHCVLYGAINNQKNKLSVFDDDVFDKLTNKVACLIDNCNCSLSIPRVSGKHKFLDDLSYNEIKSKFKRIN